jgi:hypothetical protein
MLPISTLADSIHFAGSRSPQLLSLISYLSILTFPISTLADSINFGLSCNILCWTPAGLLLSVPPGELQEYSRCSVDRVSANFVLANDSRYSSCSRSCCSRCPRCSRCSDAGYDIDARSLVRPGQARQVFSR